MKDEVSNLNIIIVALKIAISYDILHLEENYQGTCLGDAFSKAC
jgi:hypothetical protein